MFAGTEKVWISSDKRTRLEYDKGAATLAVYVEDVLQGTFGANGLIGDTYPATASVGAASGNATAAELGNSFDHLTILTLADFAIGTSGDGAALALGALLYTFPAGDIIVEYGAFNQFGLTGDISVTTDTPEYGLGTTAASGVNATLGAVATTAEDILGPFVAADVAGTVADNEGFPYAGAKPMLMRSAEAHTCYLNVADTWADVTAAGAVTGDGIIILKWRLLS
ncbi:hypothetical protein [Bauldia litoralis]|uniref:hypothetical protein n=1 Tax=Bauldia litoralis TaxID=665467 RepID=UPI0032666567